MADAGVQSVSPLAPTSENSEEPTQFQWILLPSLPHRGWSWEHFPINFFACKFLSLSLLPREPNHNHTSKAAKDKDTLKILCSSFQNYASESILELEKDKPNPLNFSDEETLAQKR